MFTLKYDALLNERKGFFLPSFFLPEKTNFPLSTLEKIFRLFMNIKFHVDVFIHCQ